MSTIPMIKEVMRFPKDWDLPLADGGDLIHDRVSCNKKRNQHSAEERDGVAHESQADKTSA